MNAPQPQHFSTDDHARETFARLMQGPIPRLGGNPLAAVSTVLNLGYCILETDVPTPHIETYEKCPVEGRDGYAREHGAAIANERQALQLIRNQESVRRQARGRAAKAKADERAAFIQASVNTKRKSFYDKLEAEWLAEATREADTRFGGEPGPSPEPSAPEPDASQLRKRSKRAA